jgi:transposase
MGKNMNKIIDFTGHNIYVGLDVHAKSWAVSIYSDEFELKSFTQTPDAEQLYSYLSKHYPGAELQVAYEAGFCGFSIHRSLTQKGIKCSVLNPADIPTSDMESKRKTDRIDSRKIAKALKNGDVDSVFVPDSQQEADRQILRSRAKIVKDSTVVKNRIKGFLKFKGISIPEEYSTRWSIAFIKWLRTVDLLPSDQIALAVYIEELIFLTEKKKLLGLAIKKLAADERYQENVKLLQSVPSIGLLAAMTILTEIGDINRFPNTEHLCSYCGLTPNSHSSGENARITGMSRRGNGTIKMLLIECAWMAVRKDPALLLFYKGQLPKMHANKAIVKVARKLLSRIRYVLKNKKNYVAGVVE